MDPGLKLHVVALRPEGGLGVPFRVPDKSKIYLSIIIIIISII